ncbi:hypothetical protein [Burkholderia sp. Bp8998]|uniref:hypothetical protein n=1 Tax=Burkholderia sp. Bp8998 TaxID=2184557 RepID=UPI000F5B7951|nr:hypothetical protein [Burkholderia sp. Bp8998]
MEKLILILICFIPFYTIGYFLNGTYINVTYLLLLGVAFLGGLKFLLKRGFFSAFPLKSYAFLVTFFISVAFGLVLNPFGPQSMVKGVIQFFGILTALTVSAVISSEIANHPRLLFRVLTVARHTFVIFSVVALLQFILWNLTRSNEFLSFDLLNVMEGGQIWRGGGMIGPLYRANSWASEPAHFSRYLGFMLSFALVRMGLLGRRYKLALVRVFPLWAALVIFTAYFTAISVLGLVQFAITVVLLIVVVRGVRIRTAISGTIVLITSVFALVTTAVIAGPAFKDKLATVALVWNSDENVGNKVETEQISALAVNSNLVVAMANVKQDPVLGGGMGSHAFAYEKFAPGYVFSTPILYRLNADDAAGLAARLISETGIVGLVGFIGFFITVAWSARRAAFIRLKLEKAETLFLCRLCFVVSFLSVFAMYLFRAGQYFDPLLYSLLGVVASIRRPRII